MIYFLQKRFIVLHYYLKLSILVDDLKWTHIEVVNKTELEIGPGCSFEEVEDR